VNAPDVGESVDLNLDTLKREISDYLESSGFAVFRSRPGGLEGFPLVLWDTEQYPDYQNFFQTAQKAGTSMILFASREFDSSEIDEYTEELEDCDLTSEERRDFERRLRDFRFFEGQTCTLELAFDYQARLYVYEVRPDWYEDFLNLGDEIAAHFPDEEDEGNSLDGYFSNN
jgi:hypothetical protein